MLIHISSGNGVDEVCRAVWHFHKWLEKHYKFEVVELQTAKCKDGIKSLLIQSNDKKFYELEGTHLWKSQSPFRAKHKRKNWYFSVKCHEEPKSQKIDESQIIYQSMKSPKKGGQHVNTTCSGVRAVYPPLGIDALSYDDRSQHRNKSLAKVRLLEKLEFMELNKLDSLLHERWKSGKEIERGNVVGVFVGNGFRES